MAETHELHVHGWNTQCGDCGYGGKTWADSPAREGRPVLGPDSTQCPSCGVVFTHKRFLPGYTNERVEPIEANATRQERIGPHEEGQMLDDDVRRYSAERQREAEGG